MKEINPPDKPVVLLASFRTTTVIDSPNDRTKLFQAINEYFVGSKNIPLDTHVNQESPLVEAHRRLCRSKVVTIQGDVFSDGEIKYTIVND